jgi:nucleotide-binding universal stress UspA family protein
MRLHEGVFRRANPERRERGYRRLLVPLDARRESFDALDIACRLAADDHAKITALVVVDVPALLPLDAHFEDVEDAARRLLEQAGATGDAYGVRVVPQVVRARDAAAAIVAQATSDRSELIVLGAPRSELAASPRRLTLDPLLRVLRGAPCRVMVVSATARKAA